VVTSVVFHTRFGLFMKSTTMPLAERTPWQRHLIILYTTSGLILVRSVFRVVEYLQGNGGYLISHEYFLYVFDAILMAITMAILGFWYIGDLEKQSDHQSVGSEDSRNLIMTTPANPVKAEQHYYRV
jgi:hypothetical protein